MGELIGSGSGNAKDGSNICHVHHQGQFFQRVILLFGLVIPPPHFSQRAPKGALRPFSVAALLHYVLWCASEYSVVGRISCHVSHDNIGINVCQRSFAEFFLAAADSESNRFYPCFRESRDVVSADIPVC